MSSLLLLENTHTQHTFELLLNNIYTRTTKYYKIKRKQQIHQQYEYI